MRGFFILFCIAALAPWTPATAQLGGLGGLPGGGLGAIPRVLPPINRTIGQTGNAVGKVAATAGRLVDNVGRPSQPELFETEVAGTRIVKGEVLAVAPSAAGLAAARQLNF